MLEADGLPSGVTCVPQVIGPKIKKGALVLQAIEAAPDYSGAIKIKGTAILNGKLANFSADRLMRLLTGLGQDVEIRIKATPRGRAHGQIRVTGELIAWPQPSAGGQ